MANDHVICIERMAKLSIDTKRLVIKFENEEPKYVAVCDIACVILATAAITLSGAVISSLGEEGAVIISVDKSYLPIALTLPANGNFFGAKRPHQQAMLIESPEKIKLWNSVIASKIIQQAKVIEKYSPEIYKKLIYLAKKTHADNDDNYEGFAAKIYWENFFRFTDSQVKMRIQEGAEDLINSCLNYGYAILRSVVARALAGHGFCLNFGLGHCRKDNGFNLADDFIEPFRAIAERATLNIAEKYRNDKELTSQIKRDLINFILSQTVLLNRKNYRLFQAVDTVVQSYGQVLDGKRKTLVLPA